MISIAGKRPDMIVHQREPFNAETPRSALASGDITEVDAFYVRNHGPVPEVDPTTWQLRVSGQVDNDLELSLDELRSAFAQRKVLATLQCAGNRRAGLITVRDIPGEAPWGPGATGTASWRGVPLADVLTAAGLAPGARHVELIGADVCEEASPPQRFAASIPRHKALAAEVLLAYEMNGAPLPAIHGAPVRAVVPGYIGARSVKWLHRINARAEPSEGFFQASSYKLLPADCDPQQAPVEVGVPLGAVAVNADIISPGDGEQVPAGRVEVSGYAFAGDDRRIVRVDVSTDGGEHWQQAELLDELSPWTWRRWRSELELPPGPAQIVARAWDSAAATQPEDPGQLWNPKGYVNNAWARISLTVRP